MTCGRGVYACKASWREYPSAHIAMQSIEQIIGSNGLPGLRCQELLRSMLKEFPVRDNKQLIGISRHLIRSLSKDERVQSRKMQRKVQGLNSTEQGGICPFAASTQPSHLQRAGIRIHPLCP